MLYQICIMKIQMRYLITISMQNAISNVQNRNANAIKKNTNAI